MLVHALSISLSISFAMAQSLHNSENYNIGVHAQFSNAVNHESVTMELVTFGL